MISRVRGQSNDVNRRRITRVPAPPAFGRRFWRRDDDVEVILTGSADRMAAADIIPKAAGPRRCVVRRGRAMTRKLGAVARGYELRLRVRVLPGSSGLNRTDIPERKCRNLCNNPG